MKRNSSNNLLSFTVAGLLSAMTAFGQTNTTGTNWVVTITAPDPAASEAGDPGLFRVARGTNTTGDLLVFLSITGTAFNGSDYQGRSNRVLIADGATSFSFTIIPIDDATPEPTESVVARVILPPAGFVPYGIGSPNTATVTITDNDGFVASNQPPVVNILQPSSNAVFVAPANISIRANAQDSDGTVASVEFFANNQSLGFGSNVNPDGTVGNDYFLTWNNVVSGDYSLTAKATDDDGAMRISRAVPIFVGTNQPTPPTNRPPVVNVVQPSNNVAFLTPANISIRAFAQDFDGFVASVEFFANNESLGFGRSTNSAGTVSGFFFLTWSNVPPGAYDLTAKAMDNDGAIGFSLPVHIFVGTNQPPPPTNQAPVVNIVQPSNNAAFLAPASISLQAFAQDPDGIVTSVEFFANNQSLGFGSNISPDGTIGNLYSLTWSSVPPGGYDLTAKATDDDGAMRISQPVHIFVGTNQPPPGTNLPPIVNIIQPTSSSSFPAPTNIFIRASARDSNGFVATVEFFANNQSLGFGRSTNATSAVNKTFFLTWSNVPPGGYDLIAKATDNDGAMAFSPPVHIFVGTNQPPPPTNQPPVANIVQPSNNAAFLAPANINIQAFARDFDGVVSSVEFFANNLSIGFGSNINPDGTVGTNYFLTWNNVGAGSYDLTAKATDEDGAMRISSPVHIFVGTNQPPTTNVPPTVNIVRPTNNTVFPAPTNIALRAFARDFDGLVTSVEFFANNQSLGFGTTTNLSGTASNFFLTWSNVQAGVYDLTAKATDDDGAMRISLPVRIFVGTNPPPPANFLPLVSILQPSNNAAFLAPANVSIRAVAWDPDGVVTSVEFFANNLSIGFGSNINPDGTVGTNYFLTWNNVGAGSYDLTAKATDDDGAMRISLPVHIFVGTNQPPPPTNRPPIVRLIAPLDGSKFAAPATIRFIAQAQDFDPFNFVFRVEFFANGTNIGQGVRSIIGSSQSNEWYFSWGNVLAGEYDLIAKATDNFGAMGFSAPVHVSVSSTNPPPPPPTNQLAVVSISATDPTASEGLSMWCSNTVLGVNGWWATNGIWHTNWPCPSGTNTATFTVRRSGGTNLSLRVYYSIGGSASNGVDYSALSGVVTIPAGARTARIVVTPVDDHLSEGIETVVLRLIPSHDPQANIPYIIGQPAIAAAYITDNDRPPPPCGLLPDGTVHLCWPLTNQCFRVELSTNLVKWEGICTNRVADGAAHHLDPDATNCLRQFIRFIPVPCPPEGE